MRRLGAAVSTPWGMRGFLLALVLLAVGLDLAGWRGLSSPWNTSVLLVGIVWIWYWFHRHRG